MTDIRRAVPLTEGGISGPEGLGPAERLAHKRGGQGDNCLMGIKGSKQIPQNKAPALLVSFFYLKPFLARKHLYSFRDWVLDSGAFSAHNSGTVIDLDAYIETCQHLLTSDPKLTEVFSLDVIGDWRASQANTNKMWVAGVPAIPTYHQGSPWSVLEGLAKEYPKIALGGMVGLTPKPKLKWVQQCFARIWKAAGPKKVHGLGLCSEALLMAVPFHSVDATNWELGPCAFGNWKTYGNMSVRGSSQNLRGEVEWHLRLERKARARWRKVMKQIETVGPAVRLATDPASGGGARLLTALEKQIEASGGGE